MFLFFTFFYLNHVLGAHEINSKYLVLKVCCDDFKAFIGYSKLIHIFIRDILVEETMLYLKKIG